MKTYRLAMRMANRYRMDEVQEAITRVVKRTLSTGGYNAAIERFVLISEHSAPFSDDEIMAEFSWICRQMSHPNGDELKPFGSHWDLVSGVMEGRAHVWQQQGTSVSAVTFRRFNIPATLRNRVLLAVRRHM